MIQIRVEFFFTLLVPTSFRGTAISSTRKLLQRGGGCVVVCAVVLVVQSNLMWRIRIMCVNVFSWYGGLFYQRASTEEEVEGARDPRRGPININKPTAPDPHHLACPELLKSGKFVHKCINYRAGTLKCPITMSQFM